MSNKIQILDESLIDLYPDLAMEVLAASSRLEIPLGWHYVLDLIWVLNELQEARQNRAGSKPIRILDLGAGLGLSQFILAELGYEVISLDMRQRFPPQRLKHCFNFTEIAPTKRVRHRYSDHLDSKGQFGLFKRALFSTYRSLSNTFSQEKITIIGPGKKTELPTITLYTCDATDLSEVEEQSIDACISISALEHNPPENISRIQKELIRVVRPGGLCLHTTSAQKSGTGFHEASHSYLLDEESLAKVYGMDTYDSNWQDWDRLQSLLQHSKRLPRWLACMYYQSDKNGMPLGLWKPEYMPIGIRIEI